MNPIAMTCISRKAYESPQTHPVSIWPEGVICGSISAKFGGVNEPGVIADEDIIDGGSF
jgi:hypothetical protein